MPRPLISEKTVAGLRKVVERTLTDRCTIIDRLADVEDALGGAEPGTLLVRTRDCSVGQYSPGREMGQPIEPVQTSALKSVTFEYGEPVYPTSVIEVHGGFGRALAFTADTTTNRLTFASAHALEANQRVSVTSLPQGGLPSPLVEREVYYVNIVSATVITLSATEGGAVIDLTTAGTGTLYLVLRKPLEVVSVLDGQTIQAGTRVLCIDRSAPSEVS